LRSPVGARVASPFMQEKGKHMGRSRISNAQLTMDFESFEIAAEIQKVETAPTVTVEEPAESDRSPVVIQFPNQQAGDPEWLCQWRAISEGRAKWEDFSFQERTCKGWLLPYLLMIDTMFSGRWEYWTEALFSDRVPASPIPRIFFLDCPDSETLKMLRKCMDGAFGRGYSVSITDFLEWLLWGFGDSQGSKDRIDNQVNEIWYRCFNLGLMLKNPYDYFGNLLSEQRSTWWTNPHAFFPTPHSVVECMVQINLAGNSPEFNKTASVCDPCVGTGRMLLHASNHSLNLYGMDIDSTCVLATKANGYIYVPWLVKPLPSIDRQ